MKKIFTFILLLCMITSYGNSDIVLGAALVDPNGSTFNFDTDGDGSADTNDEFVQICNSGSAAVDVSGFQLSDPGQGVWFTFPAGTPPLAPGECFTVVSDWDGAAPLPPNVFDANWGTGGIINNGGDEITLFDAGGAACFVESVGGGTDGCAQIFWPVPDGAASCGDPSSFDFDGNGGVAPVNFISFEGRVNDKNVELSWSTAQEVNNAYFDVEFSTDGSSYEVVGQVEGNGNSLERIDYSFLHSAASTGTNYYRLNQVDFNGANEYSTTITVRLEGNDDVKVYPFNALTSVNLDFGSPLDKEVNIQVIDNLGRIVSTAIVSKDDSFKQMDISTLNSGSYFIRMDYNGTTAKRFVKL